MSRSISIVALRDGFVGFSCSSVVVVRSFVRSLIVMPMVFVFSIYLGLDVGLFIAVTASVQIKLRFSRFSSDLRVTLRVAKRACACKKNMIKHIKFNPFGSIRRHNKYVCYPAQMSLAL